MASRQINSDTIPFENINKILFRPQGIFCFIFALRRLLLTSRPPKILVAGSGIFMPGLLVSGSLRKQPAIFIMQDEQQEDYSGLINKLQNYLKEYYVPVHDPKDAELHFTTQEIFDQLQKILPSSHYAPDQVANWLHLAGFTFTDYGNMRFEWMMKKAQLYYS